MPQGYRAPHLDLCAQDLWLDSVERAHPNAACIAKALC